MANSWATRTRLGCQLWSHCNTWGCLQVARTLIDTTGSAAGPREVAAFVTELAPVLVDKAGDNNTRVRDSASELLLWVAKRKDAGLAGMTGRLDASSQHARQLLPLRHPIRLSYMGLLSKCLSTGF